MPRDVKKITSTVDIVDVINNLIPLTSRGGKFMGVCPFHNDHKSSLMVSRQKQVFKCFACGAGGDAIDFLVKMGSSFHDACDILEGDGKAEYENNPTKSHLVKDKKTWTQIAKPDYFPKKITHYDYGKPSKIWGYYNADGSPMGYVCRFDLSDGDKDVIPYVFATDGESRRWKWMGFDKPRPLYNLHKLLSNPELPVVLVEGEKSADAAESLLKKHVVVSWQGGAEAIRNTDFTPLNGRVVLYMPDNDKPGFKAMIAISEMIDPEFSMFVDPFWMPVHWDVADEPEWITKDLMLFIKDNIVSELKI